MEYLSLGTIIDSFGLDGTLKLISSTNYGEERYEAGNKIFLTNVKTNERKEVTVFSYRNAGQFDFVKLEEINSPEEARTLKGYELQIVKNRNDLNEGYYFYSDLRGCIIKDSSNKELGIVKEVEEFPAQITLRVKRENNKDFFVPFIEQFIVKVDIDKKEIIINVMEGML